MQKKFILVHGAWHPKECWNKTVHLLHQMGYQAVAIQLKGLGKEATELGNVHLEDHVATLVEACRELSVSPRDITLMGHSYGGVVISQALEYVSELVDEAIYLSGIMLQHGESVMDVVSEHFEGSVIVEAMEMIKERYAIHLPRHSLIPGFFNACAVDDDSCPSLTKEINSLLPCITDHPLHTFFDTVSLGENYRSVKKVYVECVQDRAIPLTMQRLMHEREASVYRVFTLNSDHSPYITDPFALMIVLAKL